MVGTLTTVGAAVVPPLLPLLDLFPEAGLAVPLPLLPDVAAVSSLPASFAAVAAVDSAGF